MIFNNDFNAKRTSTYEASIKNLEKAKELLEKRYFNKEISDDEYIKRAKEIDAQIARCKQEIGQVY